MLLGTHGPVTYDAELHLLIMIRKDQNTDKSVTGFPTRLAGNEEAEDEGQWKLYFKLYCFLDVESMPKEGVEFAFMFEQVCLSPCVTLH